MANTFELIASSTVGAGGVSTVTFSSIPSTYTDLCIKFSARDTNTSGVWNNISISFGSATYSNRSLVGTGSAAASSNASNSELQYISTANATASTFGNGEFYIPNYLSSANKSYSTDAVTENNATAALAGFAAGLATYTSAISTITLSATNSASFVQYSSFYLYGVKNA